MKARKLWMMGWMAGALMSACGKWRDLSSVEEE
jgi:hypothetical protein